jgi:hypothetical protein
MALLFIVAILAILLACVAMLYREGMWSNGILLVNVVTAALLATNFFEPVAGFLEARMPWASYLCDFLSLWMCFCAFLFLLRMATGYASRVRVRFLGIADRVGGALLAAWVGWVLVCFTMMTLHTAPLSRNFMDGGFDPEERMLFGLAPDRQWLGFMQKMSLGTFCRSTGPQDGPEGKRVFDPGSDFMLRYATRRANIETNVERTNSIFVKAGP